MQPNGIITRWAPGNHGEVCGRRSVLKNRQRGSSGRAATPVSDIETVGDGSLADPDGVTDSDTEADPDGLGAAWGDGVPGSSEVEEQPATSTSAATRSALTALP